MKYNYTFKDEGLGGMLRTPVVQAESFDSRSGIAHELLAPNGSGKSFLLDFIVHSLVEDVKLEPSQSWFLSPEKVGRVEFFKKKYHGQLEGELLLDAGDFVFRSKYQFGKPVKREFAKKGTETWQESSDSFLWKHVNLAYLVPQDPTERVKKLKSTLIIEIEDVANDYANWMAGLSVAISDACQEGQDVGALLEWKKRKENIAGEIGKKEKKLAAEKKRVAGSIALEELKKYKRELQKEVELTKELVKVEGLLSELPAPVQAPDTEKLSGKVQAARKSVGQHLFVAKIRGVVSLVADKSDQFQKDFKEISLVEDFEFVLVLIGWSGVTWAEGENCFVNEVQKSQAHVMRVIEGCEARRAEIDGLLDAKLAKESGQARVLHVLRQFISFIEDNRGDALSDLFQTKLGASRSVESIEQVLVNELRNLESENTRTKLSDELDEYFEGMGSALNDYKKECKKLAKAKSALRKAAEFRGDEYAARRGDLQAKKGDLKVALRKVDTARKSGLDKLNSFEFADWSDAKVRGRYLVAWEKAYKGADIAELRKFEADIKNLETEQSELARKIRLEERKPKDVLHGFAKNRAKLLDDLLNGFPAQLQSWQQGLRQGTLSADDMKLFGSLVSNKLGGVVRFAGKNVAVDYIDFLAEAFVLKEGGVIEFARLSGAQAGEVAFRLHVVPMLKSGKETILLFDEAGDMDGSTWRSIYDWMRPNKESIVFMLKVGAKEGDVSFSKVEL